MENIDKSDLMSSRKSQTKIFLDIPSSQLEMTPRTLLKNQIQKGKNNISGWGDTLEDFNPVSNLAANASRKHIVRKLAAKRHISLNNDG